MKNKLLLGAVVFLSIFGGFTLMNRLWLGDCTQYEDYDWITGSCYFDCDTEKQCQALTEKVNQELDAYFEGFKSKIAPPVDVKQLTREETGS